MNPEQLDRLCNESVAAHQLFHCSENCPATAPHAGELGQAGATQMSRIGMPPVTTDHLQRAFVIMAYRGWTFEAAMANDTKRAVLVCCAHQLRTLDWMATQQRTVTPVKRCRPGADGHPVKWATQMVMGDWVPKRQSDLLEAAQ